MTRAMTRGSVLLLALALACTPRPEATRAPAVDAPTLEQLYLSERYGELVVLASGILAAADAPRERVAEARFFRALAWSAQAPHGQEAGTLAELRALEHEFPDLIWGRLAAFHGREAARVDALQATLLDLLLERHDLRTRIEGLEQQLVELHAELGRQTTQLAEAERERNELLEQLDEARTRLSATAERLRALEDELAALKQIDMQREP